VREYQKETDEMINKKAKALLAGGLKPIIAVGESLTQRQANETDTFVGNQVRAAFDGIPASDVPTIVVAYEPIWAIGTGLSASGEQANATIQTAVRDVLTSLYGEDVAWKVRIQYGGSANAANMAEYMRQPQIDGALVGGASLETESFVTLCRIAAEVTAEVKGVR
jgi:triosephosphate isomerase (TIM)